MDSQVAKRNSAGALANINLRADSGKGAEEIKSDDVSTPILKILHQLSPECNVNMISPGFINTKLTQKNNSKSKLKKISSMIPQKKLGEPEDIANAVEFLTKKESQYVNGINLVIDGGFSCGGFQGYIDE